jgi:lon-related putative ATP-dependent protease
MKKPASPNNSELRPEQLRWRCTPDTLGINSMDGVMPLKEIVGQDRALRAVRMGMEMKQYGYNIFATGAPGTGRTTAIKRLLADCEQQKAELTDKVYVHNFKDPDAPLSINLPAGQGVVFKKEMASFLAEILKSIPAVFESRRYQEQRKAMLEHFQDRQRSILRDFEKKVKQRGFEVVQVQGNATSRPEIVPVIDGNPIGMDQIHAKADAGELSNEERTRLVQQQAELDSQMDMVMREMRNIERKAKRSLEELSHKVVVPLVEELIDDLEEKFTSVKVHEYLQHVESDVLENLSRFHPKEEPQPSILGMSLPREDDHFTEYQVNVVVDNSHLQGVPVVIETNPRYKNLFGTIERVVDRNGIWRTDFTHIKAGSMLKADGGYLVIYALDAITEPGVWPALKRTLRNHEIEIQAFEPGIFGYTSSLKPEPIGLQVKVIMIGDPYTYQLLYVLDEDFKEIFKIRADFDSEMPNTDQAIKSYLSFIRGLSEREKLLPFDVSAVAEVVEYGVRLSGRQSKLSTQFSMLADVLRESSYWAQSVKSDTVTGEHIRKAIDERIERIKLIEEKIQEMILEGAIFVDTEGTKVGQVNGLSVYQMGEHEFGRPSRITVKTAMGRAGIINIEREAELSGPSHNKGVLILTGYLRSRYAQNKPLVLSASIAFEQSYSGVDGDSASSTEIYALLSSLSGLPLRQDLAVTGSVNQNGEIQPIGGVNLKIEGFYDVCRARGLTGTQGVLIPMANVKDLMLRHDVVEAVRAKKFHIYGINSIDEGIALLTGKKAGRRLKSGTFEPGSVNAMVDRVLSEYVKKVKKLGS